MFRWWIIFILCRVIIEYYVGVWTLVKPQERTPSQLDVTKHEFCYTFRCFNVLLWIEISTLRRPARLIQSTFRLRADVAVSTVCLGLNRQPKNCWRCATDPSLLTLTLHSWCKPKLTSQGVLPGIWCHRYISCLLFCLTAWQNTS